MNGHYIDLFLLLLALSALYTLLGVAAAVADKLQKAMQISARNRRIGGVK